VRTLYSPFRSIRHAFDGGATCQELATGEVNVRPGSAVIGVAAVLGGLLFGGTSAFGASAPAGGSIKVFGIPSLNGSGGTILITGAVGDHGTTLSIDQDGKPDTNGNYVKVTLKKGTFEINKTALDAKAKNVSPTGDLATCSGGFSVTAPVTLLDGTGRYKGITGTVKLTLTYAFILPRFASGKHKTQCNEGNTVPPVALYESVEGIGTVQFG
jgi:hypothetical protein